MCSLITKSFVAKVMAYFPINHYLCNKNIIAMANKGDEKVREKLMAMARAGGICAEGYGQMRGSDRGALIAYYTANPDWCLERQFPTLEVLRAEFAHEEASGVYVDKVFRGEVFSAQQVCIFHHCKGEIRVAIDYERAIIPMLYFANGCDITVKCEQDVLIPIRVPLYIVEDSKVAVENSASWQPQEYKIKIIEQ